MWNGNNDPTIYWSEKELCFIAEDLHTGATGKGRTVEQAKSDLLTNGIEFKTQGSSCYKSKEQQ